MAAVDHIVLSDDKNSLKRVVSNGNGLLWSRNVDNLLKLVEVENGSCGFVHSLADDEGSQLLTDCLSDTIVSLEKNSSGSDNQDCPSILTIIEKKSGVGLYKTCVSSASIIDMKASGNRIALVYRNPRDERSEMLLIESFITADEDMLVQQTVGVLPTSNARKISFTHTTNHITPQSLILHSPVEGKIYEVPLETLGYMKKSAAAPPLTPVIPIRPVAFVVDGDGQLYRGEGSELVCRPTARESTTICQLDNFEPFELSPVNKFDALPDSFSQYQCAGVVIGMTILVGTLLHKIRLAKKA